MNKDFIPIIDFSTYGRNSTPCTREQLKETGKALMKAFSEVGFVYLKNAGIEQSFIEKVFAETEPFFRSSIEEKQRYAKKPGILFGYIGPGEEQPDPRIPADFKEGFNVNGNSFGRSKEEFPDDLAPNFSNMMLEFMRRCSELSMRILNALAVGMELKDEHFFEKCHTLNHTADSYTCSKVLYYPPVTEPLKEKQIRCGSHSDMTSITLLYQDLVGGLQIQNADGEFIDAAPIEGTVVVNVGDLLERVTKGKLKAAVHRVIVPSDEDQQKIVRCSLAYFLLANHDVPVNEPLVYKDESLNETPEEKATRGEVLTAKEMTDNRLRSVWHRS